jgi:acetyl-CoA carboxylase biotin carboxyl carrier protein
VELTHADVLEILELLEGSDVDYLELEVGGTRLVADRNGTRTPRPQGGQAFEEAERPGTGVTPTATDVEPAGEVAAEATAPPAPAHGGDDLVTVTAPVVGVFYRSPEPGAPPFTEVGARVADDSTVGLVEVMKMFNSVTAGVSGRVVEILVDNDSFVEYGQALMTIEPEGRG